MRSLRWSERIGRVLLIGAMLALAWLGQGLLRAEPPDIFNGGVLLILAALLFAALAVWSQQESSPAASGVWAGAQRLVTQAPMSVGLFVAGIVCSAVAFLLDTNPTMVPGPALLAWGAGIVLVVCGAWGFPQGLHDDEAPTLLEQGGYESRSPTVIPSKIARWEVVALLALTLIALVVRVVLLEGIPQNFGGDEGEMGLMARHVLQGEMRDPFVTGWLSHPMLWFFVQAAALRVFGDTVFGLRFLSVVIGTATIPALYSFVRLFYGRVVGFAAAMLLTFYHFHIHFSRLGVNNIADPLMALGAFAVFFSGCRTRSFFHFAVAGVLLGLAQHLYMGSRLSPLLLVVVLVHQVFLARREIVRLRWHLAVLVVGFLVAFGPLLRFFLLHPSDFSARMAMVGIFQTSWFQQQLAEGKSPLLILADQARMAFGAFTYQPDRSAWYDPHIPMLDSVSSILFVLGLVITIMRWRRPDAILLLAWLVGVAVFGGMLLINSPESPRYVTAVPVLCVLIAVALEQLGRIVQWAVPLKPRYGVVLGGVVVLGLALWNLNFYFREYTPRRTYGWLNTEVATELGKYLRDQPDAVQVYFFGPPRIFIANGSIRFLAPNVPGSNVEQPIVSADQVVLSPDRRPIFVFLPERIGELEVMKRRYPRGITRQFQATSGNTTLFISYEPN